MKNLRFIFIFAVIICLGMFFLSCNKTNKEGSGSSFSEIQSPNASLTTKTTTAATAEQTTLSTTTTTSTTTVSTTATTFQTEPVIYNYDGIDVSRWQGNVDFEAVKSNGVQMVYIKAGDNYSKDIYFEQNAQNAQNAELLTGFYFYVTAGNVQEATAQAEFFAQLLGEVEYQCRPAVDFEAFSSLSNEQINDIALAFAQTLEEKTGITPIFYSDADNADIWCEELTKYPLWIADYDANPPASIGKWESYAAFQYSCTGVVDGITENVVDLDIYTQAVLL